MLPDNENRIQGKTSISQTGRPYQSAFSHLLYLAVRVEDSGKEAERKIYLRRDSVYAPGYEHVQPQEKTRLHTGLYKD